MAADKKKKKQKIESTLIRQFVDMNTLAQVFSMSLPTLRARIREGMPFVEEGGLGKSWQFDLAACIQWNTQREVNRSATVLDDGMTKGDLEMESLRLKIQRDRLEVAKLLSEVAPLEEVERALSTTFVEVRQAMLSIPDRVGGRVLACDDVVSVKELLESEIDSALSGLCEQELLEDVVDE